MAIITLPSSVERKKSQDDGTGVHQSMESSWVRPHYPLDFGTAVTQPPWLPASSCFRAEADDEEGVARPQHEDWKTKPQKRRKTNLDDDVLHETTITILSNSGEEEDVSPLPQHHDEADDDRGRTLMEQDAAAMSTPVALSPWWIQFFHFVSNLIWYVLWNAIGGPIQSICRSGIILILLLSTIVTSGMAPHFGSMMNKGKSSSLSKKADHPKGTLLITANKKDKKKKKKQQQQQLTKEITASTTSISESVNAGAAASFILSIDVNQNIITDASPSDVDAHVAREALRRTQKSAPIQTIIVRSKPGSYHGTTAVGSDHDSSGENQLHRHFQKVLVVVVDDDDDIAEHDNDDDVNDDDVVSVLTMDPTLLAISRWEAEGHIMAPLPHRVARPPHYMPPRMLIEPQEYMVVDVDNDDDDAASEDLSEIAPLDLVSL